MSSNNSGAESSLHHCFGLIRPKLPKHTPRDSSSGENVCVYVYGCACICAHSQCVCAPIRESKREKGQNEETGIDAQRFKQCQGKKIRIEVTVRTAQYIK